MHVNRRENRVSKHSRILGYCKEFSNNRSGATESQSYLQTEMLRLGSSVFMASQNRGYTRWYKFWVYVSKTGTRCSNGNTQGFPECVICMADSSTTMVQCEFMNSNTEHGGNALGKPWGQPARDWRWL